MNAIKSNLGVVGLLLSVLLGCRHVTPAERARTQHNDEVGQKLLEYIEVGEQREFTGRGPRYRLPDAYYATARNHPELAIELLKERLRSGNQNQRYNAYDFVAALAEVPAVRAEARSIIRDAMRTEGSAIREFLRPTARELDGQLSAPQP